MINKIVNQDPLKFLDNELDLRKRNNLPPYERFISLIITSSDEKKLEKEALRLKDQLTKGIDAKILGQVNAPVYKIKKKC